MGAARENIAVRDALVDSPDQGTSKTILFRVSENMETLATTKKWLLDRLPRAREEENVEREEGTDGQEEEEEEDSNLGEVNEDQSRAYNIST